ncbi:unnamed protein product [Amoebophrya sp. A120]|nr:unnamed protein product [Amoebophrya sp. A120]|eukprot:GSA120T00015431001.1
MEHSIENEKPGEGEQEVSHLRHPMIRHSWTRSKHQVKGNKSYL